MFQFVQDLRFGARTLLKTPGFSLVAILVLALGIGANSAMFTLVNALMFKPLAGRADVTTSVGFEVARPDPSGLDATTCERIRNPASACLSTYVLSAALEIR